MGCMYPLQTWSFVPCLGSVGSRLSFNSASQFAFLGGGEGSFSRECTHLGSHPVVVGAPSFHIVNWDAINAPAGMADGTVVVCFTRGESLK